MIARITNLYAGPGGKKIKITVDIGGNTYQRVFERNELLGDGVPSGDPWDELLTICYHLVKAAGWTTLAQIKAG